MHKYTVDVQATASYRDMYNAPCDCSSCRNFYKAFPSTCPEAMNILREMGLQPDSALEIMDFSWDADSALRRYEAIFCAKGEVLDDALVIFNADARITLYRADTSEPIYKNTGMQKPFFLVKVEAKLPWLLADEKPSD